MESDGLRRDSEQVGQKHEALMVPKNE